MATYAAYGHTIDSTLPLPLPTGDGSPSVSVRPTQLDPPLELPETEDVAVDRGIYSRWDGVATLLVTPDGIRVDGMADTRNRLVGQYAAGQGLRALCHLRGHPVIHAAVVDVDGHGVAICGPTGAGKSTLAAAFVDRGHDLVADDAWVLTDIPEGLGALPGSPVLKLGPEVRNALDWPQESRSTTGPGGQTRVPAERFRPDPISVERIYVLEDGPAAVDSLSPSRKQYELLSALYTPFDGEQTAAVASAFRRAAELAKRLDVRRLRRPRRVDRLDAAVDTIVADTA